MRNYLLVIALFGSFTLPLAAQQIVMDEPITSNGLDPALYQAASGLFVYRVRIQLQFASIPNLGWVVFSRSLDGGRTWDDERRIQHPLKPATRIYGLSIAAHDEKVYVAYRICPMGSRCIGYPYLDVSRDYGETFERVRVPFPGSEVAGDAILFPGTIPLSLVVQNGQVWLAWTGCRPSNCLPSVFGVWVALSTDAGATWQTAPVSVNIPGPGQDRLVKVLPAGNGIYVFWNRDFNGIRYVTMQ